MVQLIKRVNKIIPKMFYAIDSRSKSQKELLEYFLLQYFFESNTILEFWKHTVHNNELVPL